MKERHIVFDQTAELKMMGLQGKPLRDIAAILRRVDDEGSAQIANGQNSDIGHIVKGLREMTLALYQTIADSPHTSPTVQE